MTVYFHIGVEKTGSSYLQSMMGLNRTLLAQYGYYFPSSGRREEQLLSGEISPGNGQILANVLHQGRLDNCERLLLEWIGQMKLSKCDKLLISNEMLVGAFAKNKEVTFEFFHLLERVGFTKASWLLLLRDPVDQALSLYKHRLRSEYVDSVESWLYHKYKYADQLDELISIFESKNQPLDCRKYNSEPGYLDGVLQDWLKISEGLKSPNKLVNPSLMLSEIQLLNEVRSHDKILSRFLQLAFQSLPKAKKAKDGRLRTHYIGRISNLMVDDNEIWRRCNSLLPENQQLTLPKQETVHQTDNLMEFSTQQLDLLANFIVESRSLSFKLKLMLFSLKRKVIRVLKKRKNY